MTAAAPVPTGGIVASLPTPFAADGSVDTAALQRLVELAAESGAAGVLVNGLAGEVTELGERERRVALDACVEAAGALPVLAGTWSSTTDGACREAVAAERGGAAWVMVSIPADGAGDPVGAVARIAAATSLPVMIQDAPAYLGTGLGVDGLLAVLDGGPNVCALKVEGGSEPIAALRRRSLGIPLWAGDGGRHLLDAFRAGAIGAIPGVEVVDRLVAVAELEAAGAGSLADDLFTSLLPLLVFELESLARYAASAKHVLVRRGLLELAATRLAGASLDPTSRRLLDLHLERALAPVPPNARSFS